MSGIYKLLYVAIATMIFVATVIGVRMYLVANLGKAAVVDKTTEAVINKLALTYLVERCLTGGNDYIDLEFLKNNQGKDIRDICSSYDFSSIASVKVCDILTDEGWFFEGSSLSEEKHEIYVNIKHPSGDIHPGKLTVETGTNIWRDIWW